MENPGEQQGQVHVKLNFKNYFNALLKISLLGLAWGKIAVLGAFAATLEMKDFVFVSLICLYLFIRFSQVLDESFISMVKLFCLATCSVAVILPSVLQLTSQNFGETDGHKATRDLALNIFYIMALTDAMLNIVFTTVYFTSKFV